jgi:hypothetical protein
MFRFERSIAIALTIAAGIVSAMTVMRDETPHESDVAHAGRTSVAPMSWADLANPAHNGEASTRTPLRKGYGSFIVVFEEPSLAAYRGGVAGIPAPDRDRLAKNDRLRLDTTSAMARAYVDYLRTLQGDLTARMGAILGRSLQAKFSMQYAINAVVVDLTPEDADAIRAMPGVSFVEVPGEYETASDRGA